MEQQAPRDRRRRVAVLGAGIVGLATAHALHKRGFEVVVVDKNESACSGTSYANGGALCASSAAPVPGVGYLRSLVPWLRHRSPIEPGEETRHVKDRRKLSLDLIAWGVHFLRACMPARERETMHVVHDLIVRTQAVVRARVPVSEGRMIVYDDLASMEGGLAHANRMKAAFNIESEVLTPDELVERVPCLRKSKQHFGAAIFFPTSDISADCRLLGRELAAELEREGVEFLYGTEVTRFGRAHESRYGYVRTDKGNVVFADDFVVCLGPWTPAFLRRSNVLASVPIVPMKGHSVSLLFPRLVKPDLIPPFTLTFSHHMFCTPFGQSQFRATEGKDFVGLDTTPNPDKIDALLRRVSYLFPQFAYNDLKYNIEVDEWAGLRPQSADWRPLIGLIPGTSNVWLNSGHGTLGFAMSFGSAQVFASVMADDVTDDRVARIAKACDPKRFDNLIWRARRWLNQQ